MFHLFLLATTFGFLCGGVGRADPPPDRVIEAYGDSLTSGFLSGTDLTASPSLDDISEILSDMTYFKGTGKTSVLARHHRSDLAWPTRLSLLQKKASGKVIHVRNRAVSGAKVGQLELEVAPVKDPGVPTEAYFFIGHNDLQRNPMAVDELVAYYREKFSAALERWDAQHTNASAYFIPVGEVHKVFQGLAGYVWYKGKELNYTCEDSWDFFFFAYARGFHQMLLKGTIVDYMEPRISGMNGVLNELAIDWNARSRRGNHFRYLRGVNQVNVRPELFALDCFHISPLGQEELASAIFKMVSADAAAPIR